jgi:hypothetical protein
VDANSPIEALPDTPPQMSHDQIEYVKKTHPTKLMIFMDYFIKRLNNWYC